MIAVLYMLALIVIGTATLPQALIVVVAKAFVAIVDGTDEEVGLVLKSLEPVLEIVWSIYTGLFIGVALGFLADTLGRWRRKTRRRARARRSHRNAARHVEAQNAEFLAQRH